jgi:diguanylate cyclase (GGDEF)-like protein/PAS domain S-box-containing protein
MVVKHKSAVKPKSKTKSKSSIKLKNKERSKQNDFTHLSEDIISKVGVGIYIVQQGKFIYVSPLFLKLTGYSKTELISQNSLDFIYSDDREMVRKKAIKSLKGKSKDNYEYRFIRKNGEVIWVLEMISSITYKGKRAGLGSFMDITERKKMEETMHQSEERYRTILDEMENTYFELDLAGNFTFFTDSNCRQLGYSREELMGTNSLNTVVEEDRERLYKLYRNIFKTSTPARGMSYKIRRKDGITGFAETSSFPLKNQEGKIIGFRGVGRDITERRQMEEALRDSEKRFRELSIVDELTQLYNSRHFYFQLKSELDRSNRYEQPLTLLLLDLDNFKAFNDAYGHVEGDQILRRLGQILKRCVRNTDFAYRYGGEEFTILLPMTTSTEGTVIAERIRAEFKKESFSTVAGKDVHMTVSIGLAQFKLHEDMKGFVHRVDQLMYQAKKNGKDRVCSES